MARFSTWMRLRPNVRTGTSVYSVGHVTFPGDGLSPSIQHITLPAPASPLSSAHTAGPAGLPDGNTGLPVVSAAYRSCHTRPCLSLRISLPLGRGFTRIRGATLQGSRPPFYRDRNQCMTRLPGRPPAQPPSESMSTDRNAH